MSQRVPSLYGPRELGSAVRRVRQARGLTQGELAVLLGVGRMTISRLERGEPVATDTMLDALSECGYAISLVPKFATVTVEVGLTDHG